MTGEQKPVFQVAELAEEARREVAMRKRVYPRWVEGGRMTQAKADRGLALMEAIAEKLEAEAATGRLI